MSLVCACGQPVAHTYRLPGCPGVYHACPGCYLHEIEISGDREEPLPVEVEVLVIPCCAACGRITKELTPGCRRCVENEAEHAKLVEWRESTARRLAEANAAAAAGNYW